MNIVVLDGAVLNPGDISWAPLEAIGTLCVYPETQPEAIVERCLHADVVLVNKVRLDGHLVDALSHVRFIGLLATGYDNVDTKAFAQKNIPVTNVVAYGVPDVAEHAMTLLLELCHNTTLHSESVKRGKWAGTWCYWEKSPRCLSGSTMGIIGFGRIGRRVGELAHAFGMRVLTEKRKNADVPAYSPFAFVSRDELFASSDVLSLHCPLTEETRGLINAETIQRMKDGVLIINTARGPLIDEEACAAALQSGKIGGLGTDVLAVEPPKPDNPLLCAPNTLITPHMAWATTQARQRIIDRTRDNIVHWFAGNPTCVVNGVHP
ncbi:MAG: D-2-hydroxyacid dehydrogenase [Desulfovibrionaceae bacterium]|nr:D-2-hydroxyacid dehydrogenase [Desulfovibrionaceae bacterium]